MNRIIQTMYESEKNHLKLINNLPFQRHQLIKPNDQSNV
jgi:hypothetical protein